MAISFVLIFIWIQLMLRSVMAEYKYYQSVRICEPKIWKNLGSPSFLKAPFIFVSPNGIKQLAKSQHQTVIEHASKHRRAGIQFLAYVMLVLLACIVYFKVA
ncbi:hypothetical protein [Thalassotalea atypica]|uniref:hypothetical protein n=1 Tax=Thalassotalea atypica TaxID=2054316 RepID=UPI0025739028|nr:hypothetical protein [Thalassotalea atypica]